MSIRTVADESDSELSDLEGVLNAEAEPPRAGDAEFTDYGSLSSDSDAD